MQDFYIRTITRILFSFKRIPNLVIVNYTKVTKQSQNFSSVSPKTDTFYTKNTASCYATMYISSVSLNIYSPSQK